MVDLDARIRRLYDESDLLRPGVIHVLALADRDDGPRVIKIGPDSPKSTHDFFALNLARARADAIIVTGKILRDEPQLRYDLQGDAADALSRWRRDIAHKPAPPRLVVLTSGRHIDFEHPAFSSWAEPWLFTSREAAGDLTPPQRVNVWGSASPGIRQAVDWLKAQGARTISIEAGASTATELYEPPLAVDEVMRSVFEGSLDPEHLDRPFLDDELLERHFGAAHTRARLDEPSGPWRFERWLR